MAIAAIRVLEALFREAEHEPRPMTLAAELALDWLMFDKIAEDHQAGRFVEAVTEQLDAAGTVSGYMRFTVMSQMIATWQAEVRKRDREITPEGESPPADPFR